MAVYVSVGRRSRFRTRSDASNIDRSTWCARGAVELGGAREQYVSQTTSSALLMAVYIEAVGGGVGHGVGRLPETAVTGRGATEVCISGKGVRVPRTMRAKRVRSHTPRTSWPCERPRGRWRSRTRGARSVRLVPHAANSNPSSDELAAAGAGSRAGGYTVLP